MVFQRKKMVKVQLTSPFYIDAMDVKSLKLPQSKGRKSR